MSLTSLGPVAPTHPGHFRYDSYRLMYCDRCKVVYLDPLPTGGDLETLYERSGQFSDATYTDPERAEMVLEYCGVCLDKLGLLPAPSEACLEVGAGVAWMSRACKRRHSAIVTIAQDVSAECADRCPWVDHYVVGDLERVPADLRFRLISLTHVLEHVVDPQRMLAALARRLLDGGRILVTAPFRPPGWRVDMGVGPWLTYSYLHVPAHVSYLTEEWFRHVGPKLGLELQHWNADQDEGRAFEAVLAKSPAAARSGGTSFLRRSAWSRIFLRGPRRPDPGTARRVTPAPGDARGDAEHAPAVVVPCSDYARRTEYEKGRFETELVVHNLPEIYHYWSNTYLRPMVEEQFGFSHPEAFFVKYLAEVHDRRGLPVRFISIGAGNCDTEISIARQLRDQGRTNFTLDCLDLTPAMLQRGRDAAAVAGLDEHLRFIPGDFNTWRAGGRYDAIMANQSLHHVIALEHLFDAIWSALMDDGMFLTSDMIGRNGHRFWPEALAIVQEYWRQLPESYRFNVMLRREEPTYLDWDCSVEGFEGIRAQDILPLLIERFGFDVFIAFANVIDAFIGRPFGPHFDPSREWDRTFVDRVHLRDEAEILAGTIKPTHAMAVMRRNRSARPHVWKHLTPEFCVRRA
jgi:SAM-dependent methyltransferase